MASDALSNQKWLNRSLPLLRSTWPGPKAHELSFKQCGEGD